MKRERTRKGLVTTGLLCLGLAASACTVFSMARALVSAGILGLRAPSPAAPAPRADVGLGAGATAPGSGPAARPSDRCAQLLDLCDRLGVTVGEDRVADFLARNARRLQARAGDEAARAEAARRLLAEELVARNRDSGDPALALVPVDLRPLAGGSGALPAVTPADLGLPWTPRDDPDPAVGSPGADTAGVAKPAALAAATTGAALASTPDARQVMAEVERSIRTLDHDRAAVEDLLAGLDQAYAQLARQKDTAEARYRQLADGLSVLAGGRSPRR